MEKKKKNEKKIKIPVEKRGRRKKRPDWMQSPIVSKSQTRGKSKNDPHCIIPKWAMETDGRRSQNTRDMRGGMLGGWFAHPCNELSIEINVDGGRFRGRGGGRELPEFTAKKKKFLRVANLWAEKYSMEGRRDSPRSRLG